MAKLNDAWVLKYSIFREELKSLLIPDKEQFLNSSIVEISYPSRKNGVRYSKFPFLTTCINDKPTDSNIVIGIPVYEDCIIHILSRQEKLRLWNYYKLDVHYYGQEKN